MAEKMAQPGTDKSEKAETGEKEPKGAKASDSGGERKAGIVNGVGLGREDATGRKNGGKEAGEYNSGREADGKVCYTHDRKSYQGEDRGQGQRDSNGGRDPY